MDDRRAGSVGRYYSRCAPGDCLVAAQPGTSKLEHDTFALLNHVLGSGRQRYKVPTLVQPADMAFTLSDDVFDNVVVLVVEFDGEYWHRTRADKDAERAAIIERRGPHRVVRIREAPLKRLDLQDVVVPRKSDAITCANLVLLHITHTVHEVSRNWELLHRIKHFLMSAATWGDESVVACRGCNELLRVLRDPDRGSFAQMAMRTEWASMDARYDRWCAASHHRALKKKSG